MTGEGIRDDGNDEREGGEMMGEEEGGVTRKISRRLRGDGLDSLIKGRCSRRDATSFEKTRQD